MLQEPQELLGPQRLEGVDLAAREQGTDDLEAGILRRGADERHQPLLDGTQQRVLLALAEAVDLIDEEDGTDAATEESRLLPCDALQHLTYLLDARVHGAEAVEAGVEAAGDDLRQRRLAHAWRPPEDERG